MRRALRAHGRAALGVALVVGLAGGLSLGALAGARRTASAFTRFLDDSQASDLSIGLFPEDGGATPADYLAATDPILDRVRELPEVVRDSTHIGLTTTYLAAPDGSPLPDTPEVIGSLDGRYTESDRVTLLEGRLPDPERVDEVVVNTGAAEAYGMPVGSRHDLVTIEGGDEVVDVTAAPILDTDHVQVVGIVRFAEEVLRDEYDVDGLLLVSPVLTRQYVAQAFPYRFHALHLDPSADPSAVVAEYEELSGDEFGVIVRRTDEQHVGAQLALRPLVVALAVFGALTAATALALGGLGVARVVGAAAGDLRTMRALGTPRGVVVCTLVAPALLGASLGAVLAALVALLLSPFAPIGPIRDVEPETGFDLDVTAVLGGATILLVVLAAVAVVAAWVVTRRSGALDAGERPSHVGAAVSAIGLGPAGTVGLREGLGTGRGAAMWPTLASCTLAVVSIVATATFGASMDGLLDEPSRYGWAADRALVAGAGYITVPPEGAAAVRALDEVSAVAVASYAPVQLGGRNVSGLGVEADDGVGVAVTLLAGRLHRELDEVALGVNTSRALNAGIGDQLESLAGTTTVVGRVSLPAIGLAGVSHPSMAQGAVFTPEGLAERNGSAFQAVTFVDFEEGVDLATATQRAREAMSGAVPVPVDTVAAYDALRPAELVDVDPTKTTALALAVLLLVAAALALGLTLSASVRRRRAQLATLAALGFEAAELRRTVRWQTAAVTLTALVIGLPLGVVAGRLSWGAFARQIGIAPTPVVPVPGLVVVAVLFVGLAVVAAAAPARTATRTRPATALRPLA